MELGLYGWNKNINYYQSNTKFKGISAPPSPNYASLNLGDGPFDGISTGFFSGSSTGSLLGLNVPASYAGSLFDLQIAGLSKLSLNSAKGLRVGANITSETPTDIAIYIGSLSGTGRIIFGQSATQWEIDTDTSNSLFRIYTPGFTRFVIDSGGRVAIGQSISPIANTHLFVNATAAGNIPTIIQGTSGQTADLQQWQNSAGTVLSRVSATGLLSINAQSFTSLTASYSYT